MRPLDERKAYSLALVSDASPSSSTAGTSSAVVSAISSTALADQSSASIAPFSFSASSSLAISSSVRLAICAYCVAQSLFSLFLIYVVLP